MNKMPVNNHFSRLLADKGTPEKRRIPLTEVAKETGISYPTLLAWANNRVARYDVSVIDALAQYFQIRDIGKLLEYIPPEESATKKKAGKQCPPPSVPPSNKPTSKRYLTTFVGSSSKSRKGKRKSRLRTNRLVSRSNPKRKKPPEARRL